MFLQFKPTCLHRCLHGDVDKHQLWQVSECSSTGTCFSRGTQRSCLQNLCADSEFSVFCVFSVLEYTERTELVSCFLTLTLYWAICCSQLPTPHRFAISSYYSGTFSELSGCCVNAHHEEPHRNHLMFLDAIKSFNCDIIAATECSSNYGGEKCKKLHFPKRMQSFRWPTFLFPLLPHWHQRSDVFTAGAP